jgi:hypothetical protein
MSSQAVEYLRALMRLHAAASRAGRSRDWLFDAGKTEPVHQELAAAGLLEKMLGTKGGYAWRFTAAGTAYIALHA